MPTPKLVNAILSAELLANDQLDKLTFDLPVTHIYNPLRYAQRPHQRYIEQYANQGTTLLLGMNPGPYGMAQTGVPFGEVNMVRDWLGINEKVEQPLIIHPKRPIEGFDCPRSEVSGARLWGWAKQRYHTPEKFFSTFFVHNYCPLVFMAESGRNITPDKLKKLERDAVYKYCDELLKNIIEIIQPKQIIGVGAFAEQRAKTAAGDQLPIGKILHPSPASPAANKDWAGNVEKTLQQFGFNY